MKHLLTIVIILLITGCATSVKNKGFEKNWTEQDKKTAEITTTTWFSENGQKTKEEKTETKTEETTETKTEEKTETTQQNFFQHYIVPVIDTAIIVAVIGLVVFAAVKYKP